MTASTAIETADIGVIGIGVMGENLALNFSDHHQKVAVWDRDPDHLTRFLAHTGEALIIGNKQLRDFVQSLARPRRILVMIKAGEPVDEMLRQLKALLDPHDIVMDGGNSYFKDTERREREMRSSRIDFFGMGVSGGEDGARHGPSLMPGGERSAYEQLRPALEAIAARSNSGPCVTYVGPGGAGHFVKMVHNGIEYGDMQLIAEAYDVLRKALGLQAAELAEVFAEWNDGPLNSYLIEITSRIFRAIDPQSGFPLIDLVLDQAGQKGTGMWTVQTAADLGVPVPTIAAALDARLLSAHRQHRVEASLQYRRVVGSREGDKHGVINAVRDALRAAKICSYTQGMSLIRAGSQQYHWNIDLREMARIWKAGCIIRARLLDDIMHAYERRADLPNLLLDREFQQVITETERGWRRVVATAAEQAIPLPAMSASLAYLDACTSATLPQNLTQAQRDYFGAHTYQRADDSTGAFVHTDWQALTASHSGGGQ